MIQVMFDNFASSGNLIHCRVNGNVYRSSITLTSLTCEVHSIDYLVTMEPVNGGIY